MARAGSPDCPPGFITSREAGKRFGFGNDYISFLCRRSKVRGVLAGRQWLVDEASLAAFVKATAEERQHQAQQMSQARREEYRAARSLRRRTTTIFAAPRSVPALNLSKHAVASHALALLVAFAAVASGALLARAAVIPLATNIGSLASEVSVGFGEMIADLPSRIASHVSKAQGDVAPARARVARDIARATTTRPIPLALVTPGLSSAPLVPSSPAGGSPAEEPQVPVSAAITLVDMQAAVSDGLSALQSPDKLLTTIADAYRSIGTIGYDAIQGARDALAATPATLMRSDIALGEFVIGGTHAAIGADMALAYAVPTVAPLLSRAAVISIDDLGAATVRVALAVPDAAISALRTIRAAGTHGNLAAAVSLSSAWDAWTSWLAHTLFPAPPLVASTPLSTRRSPALSSGASSSSGGIGNTGNNSTTVINKTVYQYLPATTSPAITVSGISKAVLDQSLASLRLDIIGDIGNIGPPHQSESLSGTTIANGASIAATTGSFDSLTGGATSLATTTITGDLSISGNSTIGGTLTAGTLSVSGVSSGGAISAPYFTATSSTAASVFNGGLVGMSSTTLQTLTFTIATGTSATTTNFFASTASSTNLFAQTATLGALTASSLALTTALPTSSGGTGATSFLQGWLYSSGGSTALAASTSPTVNYLTATSTTVASQFPYASTTALSVSGNSFLTGLATLGNGLISQASSTVVGNFTTTGTNAFGGDLSVSGKTTLANATTSSLFIKQALAASSAAFGATATSSFSTAGALTLASALTIPSGGTGWAAIQASAIPYGSGGSALATTTAGTAGYVLSYLNGIPAWTATTTFSSGLAYASGIVTNTGVLSITQNGGGGAQIGAITLSTSTIAFNGLTQGVAITNTGGTFTFTPSMTGTLNNAGLTNSSLTVSGGSGLSGGGSVSLGGSTSLSLNLGNANTWTALQQFQGAASTTLFSAYGPAYFGATATSSFSNAGALTLASALTTANGGTGTTTWQTGSVPFFNGTNLTEDNANLFWDGTNHRLGIGTTGPLSKLDVNGGVAVGTYAGVNAAPSNGLIVSGNVGIGTTTPSALLSLYQNNNSTTVGNKQKIFLENDSSTGLAGGELVFGTGDVAVKRYAAIGTGIIGNDGAAGSRGRLYLATKTNSTDAALTERLSVLNTGNVGIGTTTPGSLFSVGGAASIGTDYGVAAPTNGLIVEGNLGIGTTSPATTLSVSGNTYTTGGLGVGVLNSSAGTLAVSGGTTLSGALTYGGVTLSNAVTGTGNMVLSTSPTLVTPALGTPSALVGTNITGTAAGLTAGNVTTNANLTGPITSVGNATAVASQTGTGSTFAMSASPTFTGTLTAAAINASGAYTQSGTSADTFTGTPTFSNATYSALFTGGNVGIGTTTPGSTLTVVHGGVGGMALYGGAAGTDVNFSIGRNSTPDAELAISSGNGHFDPAAVAGDLVLRTDSLGAMRFNTNSGNGTSALTILGSNGNVGIGTTNPAQKLQVGSAADTVPNILRIASQGGSGGGTSVLSFFASGQVETTIGLATSTQNLDFSVNPTNDYSSGLENAAKLTLTSTGNIGIGTTGPLSKLDVNGGEAVGTYAGVNAAPSNGLIVSGAVGIGTSAFTNMSTPALGVIGNAYFSPSVAGDEHITVVNNTPLTDGSPNSIALGVDGTFGSGVAYINAAYGGSTNATPLAFRINGTEKMRLDTSGNVGIGTTNPTTKLQIGDSGTGAVNYMTIWGAHANSNAPVAGIDFSNINANSGGNSQSQIAEIVAGRNGANNGGSLSFNTANSSGATSTALFIDTSGNVGIGTTTPVNKLSINGGLDVDGPVSVPTGDPGLYMGYTPSSNQSIIQSLDPNVAWEPLYMDGSNILLNTFSSGFVGIGTTPSYLLDVFKAGGSSPAAAVLNIVQTSTTGLNTDSNSLIRFSTSNSVNGRTWYTGIGSNTYFGSPDTFGFYDSTAGAAHLVINGSGNVGIGTTSPALALDINGAGSNRINGLSNMQLFAGLPDQSGFGGIVLGSGINGNSPSIAASKDSNGNPLNLSFITNGTTREYIDTLGNLTPGASNSYNLGSAGINWGCLYYNNSTLGTCASDARLKTHIVDLSFDLGTASTTALAQIEGLRLRTFNFLTAPTSTPYDGLIAQEVLPVAPELVATSSNGYYEVKYGDIQWLTLQAVQEIANLSDTFKANLIAWLGSASNGINDFFAKTIYGTDIYVQNGHFANELCVGPPGNETCITKAQLDALLASAGAAGQGGSSGTTASAATTTSATDAPSCTLAASPGVVALGDHVVLSWTTTNAATFSLDQGIGAVSPALAGTTTTKAILANTTFTGTTVSATGTLTICTAAVSLSPIVIQDVPSASSPAPDTAPSTTATPPVLVASTTPPSPTAATTPTTASTTVTSAGQGTATSTP
jgi:hypothetical protein